jgi:hypothetical protein
MRSQVLRSPLRLRLTLVALLAMVVCASTACVIGPKPDDPATPGPDVTGDAGKGGDATSVSDDAGTDTSTATGSPEVGADASGDGGGEKDDCDGAVDGDAGDAHCTPSDATSDASGDALGDSFTPDAPDAADAADVADGETT